MSLFRRESRQWQPEPIVPPFPGVRGDGSGIANPSSADALQVSAVWACVRLIASSVAMMPANAYTFRNGIRVPAPTPAILQRPIDSSTPFSAFIYQVVVSLLIRGNCYLRIIARDGYGFPTQLGFLHPDRVSVTTEKDGSVTYRIGAQVIPSADVWHLKAFQFPGLVSGLSPIQYAATSIRTDAAVGDFAYGYFRDGAHPSALLSTTQNLTQEQADVAKRRFVASVNGREPAVLSGGMSYTQVQVTPEESQFLATQKYGVAEIARIFGVPPEMIASDVSNSMTYSNVEQRSIDFLTYTVQWWLTLIEDYFALQLPASQHIRFDTSVLTRTDYLTQMKATAIGIASKQTTPDEARAKRDEPPLTDEQKKILNLVPLDITPTGGPKALPPNKPAPTNPNLDVPDDQPIEGDGA